MSGSDIKRGKPRQQPPQPFRRWSKKTLAIVGAAVLAGITAAITTATTGLFNTGVSNIRGAFSATPRTLAVNVRTVGAECGPDSPCDYSAVFPSIYKPPGKTLKRLAADPAAAVKGVRQSFTRA